MGDAVGRVPLRVQQYRQIVDSGDGRQITGKGDKIRLVVELTITTSDPRQEALPNKSLAGNPQRTKGLFRPGLRPGGVGGRPAAFFFQIGAELNPGGTGLSQHGAPEETQKFRTALVKKAARQLAGVMADAGLG